MQKDFDVYPDTKKEFPAGHPTEKIIRLSMFF